MIDIAHPGCVLGSGRRLINSDISNAFAEMVPPPIIAMISALSFSDDQEALGAVFERAGADDELPTPR